MPPLGAHVDSKGGLHLAFARAAEMGAEAIQVHPTPPNYWGSPKLEPDRIEAFRRAADAASHPPFFFHAVYLINLAGDDETLRQRSESTLAGYLAAADTLGIDGVIFHTGSHKGRGFDATKGVIPPAAPRTPPTKSKTKKVTLPTAGSASTPTTTPSS